VQSKQELFTKTIDKMISHLHDCIASYKPDSSHSLDAYIKLLLSKGKKSLDQEKYFAAVELFDLVVQSENLNEAGFLGLSLSNLYLRIYKLSVKYGNQASVLNKHLGLNQNPELYETYGDVVAAHQSTLVQDAWHKNFTNWHPSQSKLIENEAFDEYFLDGHIPDLPFIERGPKIATIGSCFATNVAKYLETNGYIESDQDDDGRQSNNIFLNDNFFNSFVIREAFEFAFESQKQSKNWIDDTNEEPIGSSLGAILYNRNKVTRNLESADVYIITLGLSEIWFDKIDGTVYPSGLNIDQYNEEQHGFRVSTCEENFNNLERIYQLIRQHRGAATIIYTLSPVPLAATFRPINCVSANNVSKSILRVSIDQICEKYQTDDHLFYFPSYEIIKDYFADPFKEDMRHIKDDAVKFVMDRFANCFLIQ
jgi:hypothetical protein